MKDTKSKEAVLVGPQLAVQRYLDDLLQEATSEPSVEELDEVEFVEPEPEPEPVDSDLVESELVDSEAGLSEEELSALDASFKDFEEAISAQVDGLSLDSEDANIIQPEP
ncbi:MAG: chemotaxis protein CheW, partial [Marinomonas polaris]